MNSNQAYQTLQLESNANFDDVKSYIDEGTNIVAVESFNEALDVISEYSSR